MSRYPNAVYRIAGAEWRALTRRRSYLVLLAGFATMLLLAAWLGGTKQVRERERQADYQALVRTQWEGQPERHPHRVAHYGTFAFKPPGPLAALDPGVDGYAGRSLFLEAHRQNASNFAEASELSSISRLGELTLAFALHLALPLIVVTLGYAGIVEERESGRLRLLAAQGLASRQFAFGKLLGLVLAVAPFVAAGLIVSFATVLLDSGIRADVAGVLSRFALFAIVVALHSAAWCGATVLVSSRAKSSAQACGALLCFWLLGCIVLPRVSAVVADQVHPMPDKSSFKAAVDADTRKLGDSHDPDDPHFAAFRRETLERYGVETVKELPVNYGAMVMAHGEALSAETFARHFARLGERMEAQAGVVELIGALSPYIATREASAIAAGTDLRAQLQFQTAAEAYRFRFVQELNALHRDEIRNQGDRDQKLAPDRWLAIEDFHFEAPSLGASLQGSGFAWLVLGGWLLGPIIGLSRYRIRCV